MTGPDGDPAAGEPAVGFVPRTDEELDDVLGPSSARRGRVRNDVDVGQVKQLDFVSAANVTMTPVSFVWEGRIPRGKLTILEGRMGQGKTTLLAKVIAAVTGGPPLPGQRAAAPQDAILISLEDGLADTLVPRLEAAGADLSRCHLFNGYNFGGETVNGVFNLSEDCERLRWDIEGYSAAIVAIDPLTATLGSEINSYVDQDVRRVLARYAQLAEDTNAAFLFTRHLRKGGGKAEDAGAGSVGIGAVCRSVLRVDSDPEATARFYLSCVKASVTEKPSTISYHIEGVELPGSPPIYTSHIVWDGESSWTADALAAQAMGTEERSRADDAREFLRSALADGPRSVKDVLHVAGLEEIAPRTLQRAADAMKVTKVRKGFGEGSTWALPVVIHAKEPSFAP